MNFVGNKVICVCVQVQVKEATFVKNGAIVSLPPTYHCRSPTGSILNLGVFTKGNLAVVLHLTFHLGFTNEGREITIITSHITHTFSNDKSAWATTRNAWIKVGKKRGPHRIPHAVRHTHQETQYP